MYYAVGLGSADMNEEFKLDSPPVTLVFDRAGKVVKRFEGFTSEEDLLAAVRSAL